MLSKQMCSGKSWFPGYKGFCQNWSQAPPGLGGWNPAWWFSGIFDLAWPDKTSLENLELAQWSKLSHIFRQRPWFSRNNSRCYRYINLKLRLFDRSLHISRPLSFQTQAPARTMAFLFSLHLALALATRIILLKTWPFPKHRRRRTTTIDLLLKTERIRAARQKTRAAPWKGKWRATTWRQSRRLTNPPPRQDQVAWMRWRRRKKRRGRRGRGRQSSRSKEHRTSMQSTQTKEQGTSTSITQTKERLQLNNSIPLSLTLQDCRTISKHSIR